MIRSDLIRVLGGCALLLIAFTPSALAASASAPAPILTPASTWEMKEMVPLNKIRALAQTPDGYLWMATENGLERFDGVRSRQFNTAQIPTLPTTINCLKVDRTGTLWIGGDAGELTILRAGRFDRIPTPSNWDRSPVDYIAEHRNGTVWVLNRLGNLLPVREFLPGDVRGIYGERGIGASASASLIQDTSGVVWLFHDRSLFEISDSGELNSAFEFADSPPSVVFRARNGGFWMGTAGHLKRWESGTWQEDRGVLPQGEIIIRLAMESAAGALILPTSASGIHVIDRAGRTAPSAGKPADPAGCLFEDREGNLWVGTSGGGLNLLRPRVVTAVEPPDHWMNQHVITVAGKSNGGLFIGTEGAAVYHFNQGVFTDMSRIRGSETPAVRSLWEDRNGVLWVGTVGSGLWRQSQGLFQNASGELTLPEDIHALFESSSGQMWFGTRSGPLRLDDNRWTGILDATTASLPDTRCFAEGPGGEIWFGMQGGGLGRLKDGQVSVFTRQDGLASDYIWSLLAEPDGTVWIGTYGSGLCRYKRGRFATVSSLNGLPNDVICSITDDQEGHLWISSYGGVFRVAKDALDQCADGRTRTVSCLTLGFDEGLSTLEFSGGCQPAACRTQDGRLWFPSAKGLAMIDPHAIRLNSVPPPVAIEEVAVDGRPLEPSAGTKDSSTIKIGPGHHQLEFHFTALSFTSPDRVRFRYRMEGLEKEWVDAGNRRTASYNFLPPGRYTFQVQACNNSGVWNETGARLALAVLPHFWETGWFAGAAGLGILAVVAFTAGAVAHRRERRKLEELERQRASEQERTRIARDIHDHLGIGLTRISMLSLSAASQVAPSSRAQENVQEIYTTTSELTRSMDEIVWAVNPHHDTLDSLVMYLGEYARKFFETARIRCRLDLPMDVPGRTVSADARHNLFLAFKEVLNNTAKHASATETRISGVLCETEFTLCIEDNGRGFVPEHSPATGVEGNTILSSLLSFPI